jgi:hypothetical protein
MQLHDCHNAISQFTAMNLLQFREYLSASSLVTWLEESAAQSIRRGDVPRHLAFVMDGNRRFAEKYNIPIAEGHLMGADVLEKVRIESFLFLPIY